MEPITLHYSEPLIRDAVKAFWVRVVGWKFFVGVTLMTAALSRLIAHGNQSWFVLALLVALILAVVGAAAVYITHLRSSLARFRAMRLPEALLELSENRLRIIADSGTLESPWSGVREVWGFPEFWLLFFSPAQFITLPTADVHEAARDFIADKVRAHGGKLS